MERIRKTWCIVLALVLLCFSSCKSKEEKTITRLDNLANDIEVNGQNYDSEDWDDAMEELYDIHEDIQDCDFSETQMAELGEKEGRLAMIVVKECGLAASKELKNFLISAVPYTKGFTKGVKEEYDEGAIDEMRQNVQSGFEEFYDAITEE